jgi:hypothetical protein
MKKTKWNKHYIRFLTFTKYKLVVSYDINVRISLAVVVVGIYNDPLGCFTVDGNDTVADPVVDNSKLTVLPGLILLGLI